MAVFLPLLLGLSLGCVGVGGFVAHVESTCLLDDSGTAKDFTYCVAFNKDLLACWDPEEGKIVPCEFGVLYNLAVFISDNLNENKALLERLGNGLRDCATHTQPFWDALTQRTRPPSVQVAQTAPINTREPVMLACYVWGFYPADVNISWMKNGNFVMPHSIKESSAQTNGDWTYQTVSYLALTPSYGDIYTCVVQHSGTPEPVRQDWTVGLSPIQTVKVSVSAVTLGLGVIIFCLGFFSWRKSRLSSYIPLPGSTYPEGRH
ncbi:class II histocompatibility antigen, M beta 1 chain [Mesocricetus auratus]|uniref:Class II histocompatibility antigen, M beta 1 chain n=1 Tax=Mesocricetus auratus TaxID=10036 RepID=A0ABM2WBA5_MESAU|nr:class II histocompatibility antigen, M beta 1 chain [Mesocricetus auratus]